MNYIIHYNCNELHIRYNTLLHYSNSWVNYDTKNKAITQYFICLYWRMQTNQQIILKNNK